MKKILVLILLVSVAFTSVFASSERPSVAVVLSGGGAKGIAHIALLEELEKMGIPVDCVMGTSMGALIAGLYAAGYTPREIRTLVNKTNLADLFTSIESSGYKELKEPFQYYNPHISLSLENGVIGVGGLIDDYKIMNFFYDSIGNIPENIDFDDLPVRFRCVALNAVTGEGKVFDSGSLVDAMRASMSIPFVFSPKEIDGELYYDGGLVDNMPINLARGMGYDIVIAEDVNGKFVITNDSYNSLSGAFDGLFRVMVNNTINFQKKNADIILNPDMHGFTTLGFGRSKDIIKKGEEEVEARRAELQQIADIFSEDQKEYKDAERLGTYFTRFGERDFEYKKASSKSRQQKAYSETRVSIGSRIPGSYTFRLDKENETKFVMNPTFDVNLFLRHIGGKKTDMNILLSIGKVISLKPDVMVRLITGKNINTYFEGGLNLNFGCQTNTTDRDNFITFNKPEARLGIKTGIKITDERIFNANIRFLGDYLSLQTPLFAKDTKANLDPNHYLYPRAEVSAVANDIFDLRIPNSNGFRIDFQSVIGILDGKLTYKGAFGIENEFFFKDENHSLTVGFKGATSREHKFMTQSYYEYGGIDGIPGYGTNALFSDFIMGGVVYHFPIRIGKAALYVELTGRTAIRSGSSGYDIENYDLYETWGKNIIAENMSPFYECFGGRGEWDIGGSIAVGQDSEFGDLQLGFGLNNHLQASVFVNLR